MSKTFAWFAATLIATPLAAQIELPGCSAPVEVEAASNLPGELARRCAGEAECWRTGVEQARALVERHPGSYDAHRIRVLVARAARRVLGPETTDVVLDEYRARAAAHPGHPAYRHLIAQLAAEGDAYGEELATLAEAAPDYPWVHLSIAYLLRPEADAALRDRSLDALARFAALCPHRIEPVVALIERVGDPAAWSRFGAGLRARTLEARKFEMAERLWRLGSEFETGTAEDYARWLDGVRADLARLTEAGLPERAEELVALRVGYELIGDVDGSTRVEDRLIESHPCSAPAIAAVGGNLRLRFGDAPSLAVERRREIVAEVLGRLEPFLASCTADEGLLTLEVEALAALGPEAGERLRAAVERWLALDGKERSEPELWAAERLVDAGVGLERAAALVATSRALRTGPGADVGSAAWREERRRRELRLAAAIGVATGDLDAARAALDELRSGRSAEETGSLPLAEREIEARIEAGIACAARPVESALQGWGVLVATAPEAGVVEREARRCWVAVHGDEQGFDAWRAEHSRVAREPGPWRAVDEEPSAVTFTDLGRATIDVGALTGKTVFLRAWTDWCGPCREELEALAELERRFAGRSDVLIRLVSLDGDPSPIIRLLARDELEVEPLFGDRTLIETGFLDRVPTAWIVSPAGRVVRRQVGAAGENPSAWIAAAAAAILEVAGPAPAAAP